MLVLPFKSSLVLNCAFNDALPVEVVGNGKGLSNDPSTIQFGSPIMSSSVWQAFRKREDPAHAVKAERPDLLIKSLRFIRMIISISLLPLRR
jgi:hypothetical protein